MSEFTDFKLPKKSTKKDGLCCPESPDNRDTYPYGLELNFENEQVKKMPELAELESDEDIILHCKATVKTIRTVDKQGGKEHSLTVQIKGVSLERNKAPDKMTMAEYRKSRGGK